MPIQTGDIRLLESDIMSDVDEGGGAITSNVIVDGQSNNIFEDISTLDRVYGAVHMRKVFLGIDIQTQDKYFGSHMIISKLPKDEKIGINLFNTEDFFDRRPSASSRVENYRAKGANYNGFLWATQWKDSKVVSIFQSEGAPVPGVGDVLYITGNSDSEFQYIKIVDLTSDLQNFTDGGGTYSRRILTLEISQALDYDFVGSQMSRSDSLSPNATLQTTVVANASKYYSARPLSVDGSNADLSVKVDTVYSQVIPSSLQELAVVDADIAGVNTQLLDSASGTVSFDYGGDFSSNVKVYLGNSCLPSTLSIPVTGGTIVDDGGTIKVGTNPVGTINYSEGTITFSDSSPTYTGLKTITFRPATAPVKIADTATLEVTDSSRGYVWVITLTPTPEPKSVQVSYLALGEWYTLHDNGSGALLSTEAGVGSGTVNYVTGTVTLTTSALPDVDSSIVFSWGQKANFYNRSNITPDPVTFTHQLTQIGIARGTLTVSWNDGVAKTATADNNGDITGDATGTVNHTTGIVKLTPNILPLGGSNFTYDYQYGTPLEKIFTNPSLNGVNLDLDLQTANLLPNSVEVEWGLTLPLGFETTEQLMSNAINSQFTTQDDGVGALEVVGGTVNYVAGTLLFDPRVTQNVPIPVYSKTVVGTRNTCHTLGFTTTCGDRDVYGQTLTGYTTGPALTIYPASGSIVKVRYRVTDSPTAQQDVFTASSMDLDITPEYAEKILSGSVRFSLGTETYIDRNGSLYFDIDNTTGAGTYGGTIDYTTGNLNITNWSQGASNTISLQSLSTGIGSKPVSDITFRVPSAPVKSLSLQIRVTPIDGGGQLTATSDAQGYIFASDIDGAINYETGVVSIRFGAWITALGNEGEDWYDANGVVDGMIFRPRQVYAETMLYNAVSQTFLPLDSDILGLDPVRLPQDGRIPIYADGDVVVILHDNVKTYTPLTAETLPLSNLRVIGNNGQEVNASTYYTVDFVGETITWAGNLTGLSQPVTLTDNRDLEIAPDTYVASQVVDISSLSVDIRTRVAKLSVRDSANQEVLATKYTVDLDAGSITFDDVSGISMPMTLTDRIEDMSVLSDVQITGTLTMTQPLTHDFPVVETIVSNAVIYGDLYARTSIPFDQVSWTGEWSDVPIGSNATGEYNNSQYPITVDNSNCIQERWAFIFTSSNLVNVIGENVGQILSGVSILSNIAPINPNTGQPFFTIPFDGWGAGWSAGNVLRVNTFGANAPAWLIQSVAQGQATDPDFNFCVEIRGDIDTP